MWPGLVTRQKYKPLTLKKQLVILSDNFGLNTSGGSIATARIFEQIQDEFESINVVSKTIGKHHFRNLKNFNYKTRAEAIHIIKQLHHQGNMVFYGDYYTSYYFIHAKVPFYFTYHDNWPDQQLLSFKDMVKSLFYIPVYKQIFKKCEALINVSSHKMAYNAHLNPNTYLVRNGLNADVNKFSQKQYEAGTRLRIIMLGNIDNRKFGLASKLFSELSMLQYTIEIDVFGKVIDNTIMGEMNAFDFVHIRGYEENIDFNPYHLLISVSKMENLSIAICEALANKTPVITFDTGGLCEVVKHGVNGLLISKFSISSIVQAVQGFLNNQFNFEFNADDLIEYDWHKSAEAYLNIMKGNKIHQKKPIYSN